MSSATLFIAFVLGIVCGVGICFLPLRATKTLQEKNDALTAALQEELQKTARLEAEIAQQKKSIAEQMDWIDKTKAQIGDHFKALSLEALNSSRESFLALAQERFQQLQENAKGDLEKREGAIKNLVDPVNKSLEKIDLKIAELEKERHGAYGELREHLKNMRQDQDRLRSETSALVQALRSPSSRGQWGEMQLKRTLEMAGLVEGVHYSRQVTVMGDEGRQQRPDIIIKLPGDKSIVIDAKAPIDAYLDALKDGISEGERIAALEKHARHVRDHIKALGSKSYWAQFETPEFVVMFLPSESYLSAALERDPALMEYSFQQKVLTTSPVSLIALMRSVAYGWQQEKLAANAKDISELAKELYTRISGLGESMHKLGRHLQTAVGSYNQAVGTLETRVLVSARKFQHLQVVGGESAAPLAMLDTIDEAPRPLTAVEFEETKAENS